jgi:hypothetical protein
MRIFVGVKPDRQQMQALNRCKLPENEALIKLFREKLDEAKNALVQADNPVLLHRLQGRAEALQDFLDSVEASNEILARL